MMDAQMLEHFSKTYEEVKGFPRKVEIDDRLVEDLGLDSLDAVEILVAIEDEYGIDLAEDERAMNVLTVRELLDLVHRLRQEAAVA
jgi:acyl carrier protein